MNERTQQSGQAECATGLGCLMMREAARAVVWGVMLLVVVFVALGWVKQQAKEAVEYTVQTSVKEAKRAVLAPEVFVPLKQNVKEAIEFTAKTAADEYIRAQRELIAGR